MVLKRDVERKLERILQDVPGDGFVDKSPGIERMVGATYGFTVPDATGPSRSQERRSTPGGTSSSAVEGSTPLPQDTPPAYEGGTVRLNHTKR